MLATRYGDDLGNICLMAEHDSAVASFVLAIPTRLWERELYAASDFVAELWAQGFQRRLFELDVNLPVHAYSTPDAIGLVVETDATDRRRLLETLRRLSCDPVPETKAAEDTKKLAVARAYRTFSETSALSSLSPPHHRYSVPVDEKLAAIRGIDPSVAYAMIEKCGKIIAAVGGGLKQTEELCLLDQTTPPAPEEAIELSTNDVFEVVQSRSAALAQISIVTPGMPMSSSHKADLHVFWTLMREREGVFYRLARSRGGLMYSVSAFSREYTEAGFGMLVANCAPNQVNRLIGLAREAVDIASSNLSTTLVNGAAEAVRLTRSLAMRNPLAVAKVLLASELAGVSADDYLLQLGRVDQHSLVWTVRSTIHNPGWRVRVTVPGAP